MKKWLVAGILGGLLICGIVVAVYLTNKDRNIDEQLPQPSITLEGSSEASRLDPSDDKVTQSAIENMIKLNDPDSNDAFTAVVREGSIVRTMTTYGAPKIRYLVDVPELQRTFAVEREGDSNSEFSSLYVRCPQPVDLKYTPKECRELE
jgi:hypothetical protein